MAVAGSNFFLAHGVISSAPVLGGAASSIQYGFTAVIVMGGSGVINGTMVPTRPGMKGDDEIETPCVVGDPCMITLGPDGRRKLLVFTEVYATEDCV